METCVRIGDAIDGMPLWIREGLVAESQRERDRAADALAGIIAARLTASISAGDGQPCLSLPPCASQLIG